MAATAKAVQVSLGISDQISAISACLNPQSRSKTDDHRDGGQWTTGVRPAGAAGFAGSA
jgi:hypothetical protein